MAEKEEKTTLEKVVKEKIEPIITETTKHVIGVTVQELNKTLIDRIAATSPLPISVNTALPYKQAKKLFKKQFFTQLIETRYGNISDVAKITGIDRRTIHRTIKELGIDIEKIRQHLLNPDHYLRIALSHTVKDVLGQYKHVLNSVKIEQMYHEIPQLEAQVIEQLPLRDVTYKEAEEEFERQYFAKALKENNNNVTETAQKIGLRYETLHRKLKALGLK